jgi:hypothetical protein
MGLLNYTRNLTSTQDLRTTGLGSKRAQTQVTVYGRTYSYVNPTSLSCVKIDSIKVIKTAYAYHDFQPDGGTPDGIIYWYDPASTGWSACHNGTQSGCVAEAFGGVATRFYKNCDLDANGIPGWQFRFAIGSPGHPYYGRIQAWGAQQGVAQIASFSTDSGASSATHVYTCYRSVLSPDEELVYFAQF